MRGISVKNTKTHEGFMHPTAGGADPSRLSGPDKYPWLTSALCMDFHRRSLYNEQPRPRARSLQHSITSNGIVY